MEQTPDTLAPMEQHNRLLMAQIDGRLRSGFGAALQSSDYYVIRNKATGVLSVLASTTLQDDHDAVHGPAPFAQCIEFVNSSVVTRMAESDGWTPAPGAAPAAQEAAAQEGTR
ncbi:hypothetical protein [Acidovorax sp. NCPPB 4044]|uniref:hypothetical protein n=1 Tax=Acidovorax sp. NCPPB 4044 TaxID=2940490 RepID=UPI002302DAF5|nr:hypothetical protein [Acidovorax sp. NCPPB 4044]MDA8523662.1 hypothetical protein [Acidovorax sp. NCPPB 4044]